MPYVLVKDFSGGLDVRKGPVGAEPGTLRVLRNAFINAGGEIEKRKAFVPFATLPAETFGLGPNTGSSSLYVVGGIAPPAMPAGVLYQQLIGASLVQELRDFEMFDGKPYVVTETTTGLAEHFYNGAKVDLGVAGGVFNVRAHRSKVYGVSGRFLLFSALNDPSNWLAGTGSGSIQVDTRDTGEWTLIGVEAYYNQLALFGRDGIQLWQLDEDPAQNQIVSSLGNIGLAAPQALTRYGNGDILFLHDSGIRSLRARDSSNAASVTDIGSPIDDLIRERLRDDRINNPASLTRIAGRVEPVSGQVWFAWRDRIFVLSTAPSTKVIAWSVFEPGFPVDYIAVIGSRVYVRSGNTVYLYGGASGVEYDGAEAEAVMPMLDAGTPATDKTWSGLDVTSEGEWTVEVGTDSSAFGARDHVATLTGPSYELQKIGLQAFGTHLSARFRSVSPSRARLGSALFHFSGKGDKG